MTWNWQRLSWPSFRFEADRLGRLESTFLERAGRNAGALHHLDTAEHNLQRVEFMGGEAVASAAIEGDVLRRTSLQSSIQSLLGLPDDPLPGSAWSAGPAEIGAAELMVELHRTAGDQLSHDTLFSWHEMMTRGTEDARDVGCYRTAEEPVRIVSGPIHDRRVHFEAPPSVEVRDEMDGFIEWFNETGPHGDRGLSALTRAGIAHLYFESIHPFEHGNGRIGRAVSEKALAQGVSTPTTSGLSETILRNRPAYYQKLAAANRGMEITDWLVWFAEMVIEAQDRTMTRVLFIIEETRLLDRLRGRMNERQETALREMLGEGPDGIERGLSAGNYRAIASTSPATTTRDLADLVAKGALRKEGQKKHARYFLNLPSR